MLLGINHVTEYNYETPLRRIVQSFRLSPAECASQKVIKWSVDVEGAVFGAAFVDGGGDRIETMTLAGPVEKVSVRITGEVETFDTSGILNGHKELNAPGIYLRETQMTRPNKAICALASEAIKNNSEKLEVAHALSRLVSEKIDYKPGSTAHGYTAIDAFESGQGVCQDQSHLLISLARCAGLPARYVTGYLLTDADGNFHEASHAWVEVYVDALGWVGLDPTNCCCPDERYVRLGSGLDAHEAAPIRGVAFGHGIETMDVEVSVSQADQQQ